MPTTYRELQATMRALRDQGKTTIRLNSSYADLMQEFRRIEAVDEVSVRETSDGLDLPSVTEIAADLIAACDDLNFHNLDALDRDERNPLIEALSYLRNAADQIQSTINRATPKRMVYRVKYDRPHLIPARRVGRVLDSLLSRSAQIVEGGVCAA